MKNLNFDTSRLSMQDLDLRSKKIGYFSWLNFIKIFSGQIISYGSKLILTLIHLLSYYLGNNIVNLNPLIILLQSLSNYWFNFTYLYRNLRTHGSNRTKLGIILQTFVLNTIMEVSIHLGPITLKPLYKLFVIYTLRSKWDTDLYQILCLLLGLRFLVGGFINPCKFNTLIEKNFLRDNLWMYPILLVHFYMYQNLHESTWCALNIVSVMGFSFINVSNLNYSAAILFRYLIIVNLVFGTKKIMRFFTKVFGLHDVNTDPCKYQLGVIAEYKNFILCPVIILGLITIISQDTLICSRNYNHILPNSTRKIFLDILLNAMVKGSKFKSTINIALILFTIVLSVLVGFFNNFFQTYIHSSSYLKEVLKLKSTDSISPTVSDSFKIDYQFLFISDLVYKTVVNLNFSGCTILGLLLSRISLGIQLFITELIIWGYYKYRNINTETKITSII